MRIAALIFGLFAGLLAGLVLAFGNIDASLAALPALGSGGAPVARFVVYLVPAIGWIGAGLVLARPRIGGIVLLLSAAGWAALAFAAGHGAVLFAALPFTFAAAAGIVALFAHRGMVREARRAAPPLAASPKRVREVPAPPRPAPRPQPAPQLPPTAPVEPTESLVAPRISPPFRDDIPDEPAVAERAEDDAIEPIIAAMATTQTLEDAPLAATEAVEAPKAESVPLPTAASPLDLAATPAAPPASPAMPVATPLLPAAAVLVPVATPVAPPAGPVAPAAGAEEALIPAGSVEAVPAPIAPPAVPAIAAGAPDLRARRPGDWSLPSPADLPAPRYAAERQSPRDAVVSPPVPPVDGQSDAPQPIDASGIAVPPAASEPPPPTAPAEPAATLDFAPTDDYGRGSRRPVDADDFPPAAASTPPRGQLRRPVRGRRADVVARSPERRAGGLRTFLRGAIAAIFVILVIGGAGAIYLDYLRGPQSILFGRRLPAATQESGSAGGATATSTAVPPATSRTPAPEAAAPASPAAVAPARPAPGNTTPAKPVSTATPAAPGAATATATTALPSAPPATATAPATSPPAASSPPTSTVATAPPAAAATTPTAPESAAPAAAAMATAATDAAPPAVAAQTFSDPVRYCTAVGTIDAPDSRYTGPAVPPAVDRALLLADSIAADEVHWRCSGGVALACNANHTDACAPTPTVQQMLQYCAKHPGAKSMPAPNGSWSCNGTRPVIPEDQSWPVDARGFFPDAWVRVSPLGSG